MDTLGLDPVGFGGVLLSTPLHVLLDLHHLLNVHVQLANKMGFKKTLSFHDLCNKFKCPSNRLEFLLSSQECHYYATCKELLCIQVSNPEHINLYAVLHGKLTTNVTTQCKPHVHYRIMLSHDLNVTRELISFLGTTKGMLRRATNAALGL
jgi:hypothetical protein